MKHRICGLLAALMLVACSGGDEDVVVIDDMECGPGTHLQDKQCVVKPFECPDGEVPLVTGHCHNPDTFCGHGTAFDTASMNCVPTNTITCGAGTVEVDGRCLIEDALSCGEGTVLSDGECRLRERVCGTGTTLEGVECVPTASGCGLLSQFDATLRRCVNLGHVTCGEDTVQQNNRCIPMHTFVDQLWAEATVDASDAQRTISLGSTPGDRVVFKGSFAQSSNLMQSFPVVGSAGRWVEVSIYPRGVPSVGFRMLQTGWERRSPAGTKAVASRTMKLPVTGEYSLQVNTSLSGSQGGPYGNDSWMYVGVIEVIEAPEPTQWDLFQEPIAGDLRSSLSNFVEINLAEGQQAVITPEALGADANTAYVYVWNNSTSFNQRFDFEPGTPIALPSSATNKLYLHFDVRDYTGTRTHFGASAFATKTVPPGGLVIRNVAAEAGQLIYLAHASTGANPMGVRVLKDGETLYENNNVLASNRATFGASTSRRDVFYVRDTGTYTVEFENVNTSNVTGFHTNITTHVPPTLNVGSSESVEFQATLAQSLPQGDWRYIMINTEGVVHIEGFVQAGSGDPDLTIYDGNRQEVSRHTNSGTRENFNRMLPGADNYMIAVRPWSNLSGTIFTEITATPMNPLMPGDAVVETFSASTFDILTTTISYHSGTAPTLRVVNPYGQVVMEKASVASGTSLMELIPGNGQYTLELVNKGSSPTMQPTLEFSVHTPVAQLDESDPFDFDVDRDGSLSAGEREFYLIRTREEMMHTIEALVGEGDTDAAIDPESVTLRLWNLATKTPIASKSGTAESTLLSFLAVGRFALEVIADTDLADGYALSWSGEEFSIASWNITSTPNLAIPDNTPSGITDSIAIPACPSIYDITVDINITHTFRGDLIVRLTSPIGQVVTLHNRTGGSTDNIIATYPFPGQTGLGTGEGLLDLVGTDGGGQWQLFVGDNASLDTGTLNSWTLNLDCN